MKVDNYSYPLWHEIIMDDMRDKKLVNKVLAVPVDEYMNRIKLKITRYRIRPIKNKIRPICGVKIKSNYRRGLHYYDK